MLGSDGAVSRELPRASNNGPETGFALPYSDGLSFDLVLSAELAVVFCVLRNFVFLGNLSERASVSGAELSNDSLFLGSSCHVVYKILKLKLSKLKKL